MERGGQHALGGTASARCPAAEDPDIVYRVTGDAGVHFWERLGFVEVGAEIEPYLAQDNDFARAMRQEAAAQGIDPQRVQYKHTMRRQLVPQGLSG